MSYVSGHCAQGHHLGSKILSQGGTLFPSCTGVGGQCTCNCHPPTVAQMLANIEKNLGPEAVATVTANTGYTDTTVLEREGVAAERGPVPAASGTVPPIDAADAPPVTDGRRARGSLDYEIQMKVNEYLKIFGNDTDNLTPKVMQALLANDPPTSVGAIDACWNRWAELGFAMIDRKPTRFRCYTEEGVELGLARMKSRAKRRAKSKW